MAFTFFFRDKQTLDLIQEHVVPVIRGKRYINIWDAGCAMGPEPYSLAMMLREKMGQFIFRNIKILATDIDNSNLFGKIIMEGIYDRELVGRIPKEIFKKYFSLLDNKPGNFILSREIKDRVEYLKHDLLCFNAPRTGFCLILCKNVLLHFKQEEQIKVIDMFYSALESGGFLVMEQTQKMPSRLDHKFGRVVSNAQIYQKLSA